MRVSDLRGAYALPWTTRDNPQCFLEVTRQCNLRCPSCYQREGFLANVHKPLALVFEEIEVLIRAVRPSAVCIVGGEPLEHPQLEDIVRRVAQRGCVPALFTNALGLDPERLGAMARAGLRVVYAHLDTQTQNAIDARGAGPTLRERRESLVRALWPHRRKLYGIVSAMVGAGEESLAVETQHFAYGHSEVIRYCVFTLAGHRDVARTPLPLEDLYAALRSAFPGFRINSFLGGTASDRAHWAQAVAWVRRGLPRRFLAPRTLRALNGLHRIAEGRYVSLVHPRWLRMLPGFFTTVIVEPNARGSADFCAGCPDQTVVWAREGGGRVPLVVHSCRTPELLRDGGSPDEATNASAAHRTSLEERSFCALDGRWYQPDIEILGDWNALSTIPRVR